MRDSLAVKRESIQVVDAISAEDVGDFPDKNIGEAIQRVPGVQINRQDGEGRSVSIRGADQSLIRVELNGVSALSLTVGGGRDVDFRDLPVEFVSRVEVVKTPTAEMTEGGIGTVRVVTRKPFDDAEGYLAGSVQGVYSDLADATDPEDRAHRQQDISSMARSACCCPAQYEARHIDSNNARTTGWLRRAPTATGAGATPGRGTDVNADGTLDWIPDIPRYIIDRRETDRAGLQRRRAVEAERRTSSCISTAPTAKGREEVSSMLMQLAAAGGLIDYANSTRGRGQHGRSHRTHQQRRVPDGSGVSQHQWPARARAVQRHPRRDRGPSGTWKFDGRVSYSRGEVQNDEKNSTATIFGVPRAHHRLHGQRRRSQLLVPGPRHHQRRAREPARAPCSIRATTTSTKTGARFNVEFKPEIDWLTSIKAGVETARLSRWRVCCTHARFSLSSRTPTPASAGATTYRGGGAVGDRRHRQ